MSGRHRVPSKTSKRLGAAALVGGLGALAPAGVAQAGPDGGWGPIISCESGGNARAQNSSSTASGLFQFIDGTWKAYGGSTAKAKHASVAEQFRVAERAYAAEGTRPWNSSESCWSKRAGAVMKVTVPEKKIVKTQPLPPVTGLVKQETKLQVLPVVVPKDAKPTLGTDGDYTVKTGDTLTQIAVTHNVLGGWKTIAEKNRDVVEHQDWIFPGEALRLK